MSDAPQIWNPTFAERFDQKTEPVGEENGYARRNVTDAAGALPSGRKRVGSDHCGLCRRPPPGSRR